MLLSSLVYMFEADTRDLDKGAKQAKAGADDLTDALQRSENQAKRSSDTLMTFAKGALGWLGAAASAGKVMSMAVARAGEVSALDQLSSKLGASITETDALARSIADLGASSQEAQDDLGRLADGLQKGGIKPMEGLLQLSDQLAGMDYGQAAAKLNEYGITNSSTIELLRKGRAEIERSMKQQMRSGAITEEAAEKARKFNASLTQLKGVASGAANGFIQWLMPALTKITTWLAKVGKWASENKHFVIGFFAGVAAIVGAVFLPSMAAAAVATLAATWPFIAIGLAIGAAAAMFAVIYDDIMTFIDGGDSMIGMVLDKFPVIGEVVTWLWDTMKLAFEGIVGAGQFMWNGLSGMADGIVGVFKWLWDTIQKYIGFIGDGIAKVKGAVDWVKDKVGMGDSSVDVNTTALAKQQIDFASGSPMASTTSGAIRNAATGNSTEQNLAIGEITIQTQATDAQGMASSTRSELQDQLQKMQANNATAIAR